MHARVRWLLPDEFARRLGCARSDFATLPPWKQRQLMRLAELQECEVDDVLPSEHRELAARILECAKLGGGAPGVCGSAINDFGEGYLADVIATCLCRDAEVYRKDNFGPHGEVKETLLLTRHLLAHEVFGYDHVVELMCQVRSTIHSGYGYERVSLLPVSEVMASGLLVPVEQLAARFDDVMRANFDAVQRAKKTCKMPPTPVVATVPTVLDAANKNRYHPGIPTLADLDQKPLQESTTEIRAMLIGCGYSDSQIDAAIAAARGNVNAAAERLMDQLEQATPA